jgi:hypothetical protein
VKKKTFVNRVFLKNSNKLVDTSQCSPPGLLRTSFVPSLVPKNTEAAPNNAEEIAFSLFNFFKFIFSLDLFV